MEFQMSKLKGGGRGTDCRRFDGRKNEVAFQNGEPPIPLKRERYVWDEWTQRDSAKMDSKKLEPEGRSAAGCPLGGEQVNLLMVLNEQNKVIQNDVTSRHLTRVKPIRGQA